MNIKKLKKYQVQVRIQGNAVVSNYGYVAKESENIILLHVDAVGIHRRAYPDGTSICQDNSSDSGIPEIWLSVAEDDKTITCIVFPELTGWEVFCVNGGKTLSIALQKGRSFEA